MDTKSTYPWLCSDLGGTGASLTVDVSIDGIVQEERILIEVVLGLDGCHSAGLVEREFGFLKNSNTNHMRCT